MFALCIVFASVRTLHGLPTAAPFHVWPWRVEQAEDDEEHGGHNGVGLELGERELLRGVLEASIDTVHLLGLRRAYGLRARGGAGLHGVELARVALDGGAEGVVGGGAVGCWREILIWVP
jgi:hypothetical protein